MLEIIMRKYLNEKLNIDIKPSYGNGKFPIFTYTHSPLIAGVVNQSQYEIKIISNDLDEAIQYRDEIIQGLNLNTQQRTIIFDNYSIRPSLSGGGQIFNDSIQVWELSLIFIIKWRKKNGKK